MIVTEEIRELERRLDKVKDAGRDTDAVLKTHLAECIILRLNIMQRFDKIDKVANRVVWGVFSGLLTAVVALGVTLLRSWGAPL